MSIVKARYKRVARQTRSSTSVALWLPFTLLFDQFIHAFLAAVAQQLAMGRQIPESRHLLATDGVGDALDHFSSEATQGSAPRLPLTPSIQGLNRLAGSADDLATEGGAWCEVLRDVVAGLDEAAQRLRDCVRVAARSLLQNFGPFAARQLIEMVQRVLLSERTDLQFKLDRFRLDTWMPSRSVELRSAAEQLRRIARSVPWTKRCFIRCFPPASRRLLSQGDRFRTQRLHQQINEANCDRHRLIALQVRLNLLDALLGNGGIPGQLSEILSEIEEHQQILRSLENGARRPLRAPVDPSKLNLADSLETIIDPATGQTIGELYFERLEQAGFTIERFVEMLRTNGLIIDGRPYLPCEWNTLDPTLLSTTALAALKKYLGADDGDRSIHFDEPQTALDHLARITPADEELRQLVNQFIPKLARLSKPFAVVRHVIEADPREQVFLYCHPAQRSTWESLFRNHVPLCIPDKGPALAAYNLGNPHVVVLVNGVLGIAGGSLDGFQRWMATGNRTRREHTLPPLFPRQDFQENRLVGERDDSHEYAEHLWTAAEKARQIYPVGNPTTGYALSKPDPRVEHLFVRRPLIPSWHAPEHYHDLLKQGTSLALFIERQFPTLVGFRHATADRLAQELDGRTVCEELVSLGVLDRNPAGQYRVRCNYSGTLDGLTELLFTPQASHLVGLPRDMFIAAIQRDNELHNLLFWAVLDAFQLGDLAEFDVPPFILRYHDTLQ